MDKLYMGIELGSTRVKAVLVSTDATILAQGSTMWKSELRDGFWTYDLNAIWEKIQSAFSKLRQAFQENTGKPLTEIHGIGISAMMHGYLAFDQDDNLLVPFRTWQNTNTAAAAEELSRLFNFNIPQRWSVAHYYQAVLNEEPHIPQVAHMTTLAGYVHECLTGRRVLGIGDASGMFPVAGHDYDHEMFRKLQSQLAKHGIRQNFRSFLPDILLAGEHGGYLTPEGAQLLDPTGCLRPGAILCPPEGDAGTGMIATNSILPHTANISAGTSAFLMAVLDKPLSAVYPEIDMVATPTGNPVAMIHINNFTVEINAWAKLFAEVVALGGGNLTNDELFDYLYHAAANGDDDCGGLMGYNFHTGEPIVGLNAGTPLLMRRPDGHLTLPNLMKMQIYSALGALSLGMDVLRQENIHLHTVCGHGGFFQAGEVTASAMSAAIGAPITLIKNSGEGGAWGAALLAIFSAMHEQDAAKSLASLFSRTEQVTISANAAEQASFSVFMRQYRAGLALEHLLAHEKNK